MLSQVANYLMVWDSETPQRNNKICSQQKESNTDAPRRLSGLYPDELIISENVFNTLNLQNIIAQRSLKHIECRDCDSFKVE